MPYKGHTQTLQNSQNSQNPQNSQNSGKSCHRYQNIQSNPKYYILNHGNSDEIIDDSFNRETAQEREANIFASRLLMPSKLVEKIISEVKKPTVDQLAKKFNVSTQAMTIRLIQLDILHKIS